MLYRDTCRFHGNDLHCSTCIRKFYHVPSMHIVYSTTTHITRKTLNSSKCHYVPFVNITNSTLDSTKFQPRDVPYDFLSRSVTLEFFVLFSNNSCPFHHAKQCTMWSHIRDQNNHNQDQTGLSYCLCACKKLCVSD